MMAGSPDWLPFQRPCSSSVLGAVHGAVNNAIFVNMPRLGKTGEFALKHCGRTGMGYSNLKWAISGMEI
jgi:hypothetical protein